MAGNDSVDNYERSELTMSSMERIVAAKVDFVSDLDAPG